MPRKVRRLGAAGAIVLASNTLFGASLEARSVDAMGAPPPGFKPPNAPRIVVRLPPEGADYEKPFTGDSPAGPEPIEVHVNLDRIRLALQQADNRDRESNLLADLNRQLFGERDDQRPGNPSIALASPPSGGQQWGPTITQLFFFNTIGHAVRMLQKRTRDELGGPFLKEWLISARPIFRDPHWDDEGSFSINYIGHPMSGAAYGMVQRQNNGQARDADFGSAAYWRNLPKAFVVSALASLQFEIGPISEASLGNVGLEPEKQGYVDLVVTPVLGMAWMIGQDMFDKYVTKKFESKVHNRTIRGTFRSLTDLPQSMANLVAGRAPWYRPDRPVGGR